MEVEIDDADKKKSVDTKDGNVKRQESNLLPAIWKEPSMPTKPETMPRSTSGKLLIFAEGKPSKLKPESPLFYN